MKQLYEKIFKLALVIIIVLNIFYMFPPDDGLRHVGLAFGNFTSWGDVYPFSIFEEFKDYNPWFGYDLALRIIVGALKHLPISLLLISKFILIKSISGLFSLIFFFLVLDRSGIFDEVKGRHAFTLAIICVVALLSFPFFRVMIARPFAFGTFFIIFSIGRKGIVQGFLSSLFLAFFYPYLCWFYILPVAFTHYIRGDRKFALGAIALIVIFLLIQPPSFWGFQIALVNSDIVREAINAKISEFISILKYFPFYLYLAGFIIIFPYFTENARRLNYVNVLILLYLIPSLKYNRYFVDIILPLLFISFGSEIVRIFLTPSQKFISSWRTVLKAWIANIKISRKLMPPETETTNPETNPKPGRSLKPYIIVTYLVIFSLLFYINFRQIGSLKEFRDQMSPIPEKSLVLTSFNLQYKILFLRPDLRLIPSCEIGFARNTISKEYINFLNEGMLRQISQKTGAKYLLESKDIYLNPEDGRLLKLLKANGNLKLWRILNPSDKKMD
ncbi:MAG: hypothetical protein P8X68_22100 [Desulfobacterales bacterium]|jgi:hypothetical protein